MALKESLAIGNKREFRLRPGPFSSGEDELIIRATIATTESNRCEAEGYSVRANAPVLALCRKLVENGYDPARPLHAYRGDTLALTVTSIGHGAQFTVEDNPYGTPVLRRFRDRQQGAGAAPPVRRTAEPVGVALAST